MNSIVNKRLYFRIPQNNVLSILPCTAEEALNLRPDKSPSSMHYARMKNLSASGILMESEQNYRVNDILKMEILLDLIPEEYDDPAYQDLENMNFEKKIFRTIARVVRVEQISSQYFEVGLEFLGVEKKFRDLLIKYVESHLPKRPPLSKEESHAS